MIQNFFNKMRGGKRSPRRAPYHEIFWSAIGSFLGIYSVYAVAHLGKYNFEDTLFLIGSFGASAVLLYGLPKCPYSQPRNLVLGHSISAAVGVSCALVLPSNPILSASLAVSLALVVMHLTRSIHPPGGATALIAVIGSEHIHQMKYWYVFSPVFIGAAIMLIVALLINNLSPHRRYPEYWI